MVNFKLTNLNEIQKFVVFQALASWIFCAALGALYNAFIFIPLVIIAFVFYKTYCELSAYFNDKFKIALFVFLSPLFLACILSFFYCHFLITIFISLPTLSVLVLTTSVLPDIIVDFLPIKNISDLPDGVFNRVGLFEDGYIFRKGLFWYKVDTEHGYKKFYVKDGKLHNDDGPAVYFKTGHQWMINDFLHREDGPAIEWNDGSREWYSHGRRHRIDGPAMIENNGTYIHSSMNYNWYVNDIRITREVIDWMKENNCEDWFLWDENIKIMFRLRFE